MLRLRNTKPKSMQVFSGPRKDRMFRTDKKEVYDLIPGEEEKCLDACTKNVRQLNPP